MDLNVLKKYFLYNEILSVDVCGTFLKIGVVGFHNKKISCVDTKSYEYEKTTQSSNDWVACKIKGYLENSPVKPEIGSLTFS